MSRSVRDVTYIDMTIVMSHWRCLIIVRTY